MISIWYFAYSSIYVLYFYNTGEWMKVVHNRRVQMQLFVFARRELEQSISHIEKSSENTGFLHVFPNKGGINVSMSIDGTTLAFVSCHLAAHEGVSKCASRNQSCYEILEGIRSGIDQDLDVAVQFHHTIWMGMPFLQPTSVMPLTDVTCRRYELSNDF